MNSILGKEIKLQKLGACLTIREVCLFKTENVMLNIEEVNRSSDWVKPGYLLFAWTEDGGAMYFDVAGEKPSIYWLDHETDEMFLVADSCKKFIDIFCG